MSIKHKIKEIFAQTGIWKFFAVMFVFGAAVGIYMGSKDNYLFEILHFDEADRGILEFFRELPGLALVFILALLYRFSENKILRIGVIIALIGSIGMVFWATTYLSAFVWIIVWSLGEHLLMPIRRSIATHSAKPGHEGLALGLVSSIGGVGQTIGFFIVAAMFYWFGKYNQNVEPLLRYQIVYGLSALFLAIGVVISFMMHDEGGHVKRQRLLIKKKYNKYYILEMFYGARKQVFITFAPYVIITIYSKSTAVMAMLHCIYSILNIFLTPILGSLIDKIGYRTIMILDTVVLFFVCLIYGFAHRLFPANVAFYVICVTFILDAMVSRASMATSVYVRELSGPDKSEMTATLSTGISINHFISILIALAGGFIWKYLGVEMLFVFAALMAVGNTVFACTIPKKGQRI